MAEDFIDEEGNSRQWIDGDTIEGVGNRDVRIQGLNAPETNKVIRRDGKLRFVQGQLGADETTEAIARIAKEGGYNKIVDTGLDSFGRDVARIENAEGGDLTNALYKSGAIQENIFTDSEGIRAAQQGRLQEQLKGKRDYQNIIHEELGEIQQMPVLFKESANNEKEYLDSVMQTIALQKGYDLTTEEDYKAAYDAALDGNYDTRSLPFNAIDFSYGDRDMTGVAYNQFTESWNTGWKGMATALAGFAELAGVGLGIEDLERWGATEVELAKDDLSNAPILRNLDFRDVDGLWDGWQYLTNNMAMSAPYLITLSAGHLLSPVTFGASLPIAYGSMVGVHSGNVWNDIEGPKGQKEAAGALVAGTAMAVMDRLGMQGILAPSKLLTSSGRLEVAKQLKKQSRKVIRVRGKPDRIVQMTTKEALAEVEKVSKSVIKGAIQGMGNFASDHINRGSLIKNVLKGAGRGGLTEAVTEAAQEGTGYIASKGMSEGGLNQNFNPNEFSNLLASAAVAGGSLGASFGAAGSAVEAGDRYAMSKGLMLGRVDKLNPYDQISQELGRQGAVYDITRDLKRKTFKKQGGRLGADYATKGEQQRGSLWDKIKNPTKYLPELYRAAATTAFRPELLRRSAAARKLYGLVGQPLGRLYSGRDVGAQEQKLRADLLNQLNAQRIFKRFGLPDRVSSSNRISDMIRRFAAAKGDRDALIDDQEVMENYDSILTTINELQTYMEMDYNMRNDTYLGQGDGRTNLLFENWLDTQGWDWKKVRDNRDAWFKWMRGVKDSSGKQAYTEAEIEEMYNKISNNEDVTDFSIVEGVSYVPGSVKGDATKNLSSIPGYEQFANTDILQNLINRADQTAKYKAYTEYFGEGGKYLDQLYSEMKNEGLTDDEIAEVAYHTKSIIDAGTGNYKPIKNRKIANLQRAGAFYASTVGLPLAAFSSIPEFIMILWQGRGSADVKRGINSATGELVEIFKGVVNMKQNPALKTQPNLPIYRQSVQDLIDAGLFPDDATVATRYGLGETDISKAWWQKQFFKFTGIAGITQLQRSIAAAAVAGFVSDRIKILLANESNLNAKISMSKWNAAEKGSPVLNVKTKRQPYNQDQLEVYRQLANLGMDVDEFIRIQKKYTNTDKNSQGKTLFDRLIKMNPNDPEIAADMDFIQEQMETVTWYFVNDRVQNPQAYNRPLFFQDPHFQLFVQFNGFISTFTANIVPKLWNDYLKNGSPRMQYNTFALICVMTATAGAAQWLKDYLKFGGSTPYLSNEQLVQRALMNSGVLGTSERILNAAFPLYADRDEGIAGRIFGETVGGAPTARLGFTAGRLIKEIGEGDYEGSLRAGTKMIPGVAPVTPVRNAITDLMQGQLPTKWPFNQGE